MLRRFYAAAIMLAMLLRFIAAIWHAAKHTLRDASLPAYAAASHVMPASLPTPAAIICHDAATLPPCYDAAFCPL